MIVNCNGERILKAESQTITIIRVIATLLIVLCHYVSWIPRIAFTGQFFNVGIPLFFIISGYLYGQKKITNVGAWLKKRYIALSVPLYLYYIIGFLVLLIPGLLGTVNGLDVLKLFLHLQGLIGGGYR